MTGTDRIRILIVENEGLVGCDMASSLGKLGYHVTGICASGEEALERFDEMQPDLVLLDVHLAGEIDGIETARRLQTKSSVAILYVTACADLETVTRARETHPQGYLLKPFSHDELRLAVEVAAQRHLEEMERRRREQSFFEAFQSLADGVIATDLAGGIVFVNPAAARVTGWQAQEAAGRSLNEVFRIFQSSGEPAEVLSGEGEASGAERTVWLTTRSGTRVPIQDRSAPLRDAQGHLTGLIILFRPILQESTTQTAPATVPSHASAPLVDIVESISDPLIALDAHWRLTYANASATQLFERESASMLGMSFWDLVPAAVRDEHHEAFAHALMHREPVSRDLYYEAKRAWLELRGYPFGEGMLMLVQDVTAKREEAEILE